MQAVTRVNAEQAPKALTQEPTRRIIGEAYGDSIERFSLGGERSHRESAALDRRGARKSDAGDVLPALPMVSPRGPARATRLGGQGVHGHPPGAVLTTVIHQVALSPR